MKEPLVDISVLILFFNRPDRLQQVFAQVQQARPARLFLYQDGPRTDEDREKIDACRNIVDDSKIDWDCVVRRNYQSINAGCDPSGYNAQAWAFSQTDKLIILEDDCVPSVSFFTFCKELLDRYENDPTVAMIAGFNALDHLDIPESYFFTDVFSIWGWAAWRRTFDTWDKTYHWLDDTQQRQKVEDTIRQRHLRSDLLPMCQAHKQSTIPHFETIAWAAMLLNGAKAIMTTYNQVNNIGIDSDSTHFSTTLDTMPRRLRRQFTMPRYEIQFPLIHPTATATLTSFQRAVYLLNAWDHPWRKAQYSIEELFLSLRHRRFKHIRASVVNRTKKMFGKR